MRPSPWLRSVVLLLVLGALAMLATAYVTRSTAATAPAPAGDRPVPLDEAVERTLAAGTARLGADLTTRGGRLQVAGVTSLATGDGDLTFEVEGEPGLGAIGLRTVEGRHWVRVRDRWMDASDVPGFGDLPGGWGDYVAGLEADGSATGQPRRATLHGRPAQVWLDGAGRVARVVVVLDGDRFDLRFSDFGIPLDLAEPATS